MPTHFYTIDPNERQNAIQNLAYTDEGIACYVYPAPPLGPAPFYRSYQPGTDAHFYTLSLAERDNATNNLGHKAEGVACYLDGQQQAQSVPMYRAYQPSTDDHFYTTNLTESENAVQHLGYSDDGAAGYVMPGIAGDVVALYRLYGPPLSRYLGMNEESQSQTEWCWAATTVSITRHYDPRTTWTQCSLANKAFSQTTCCSDGSSSQCNKSWFPDSALNITGHLARTEIGGATIGRVMSEITAGRPISVNIQWKGGGGHNPAIDGFDNSNPAAPTIDIQDPLYGHSTQDFNTFPGSYHGAAASWYASYFTQ